MFMPEALAQAYKAFNIKEVPVGAVIVDRNSRIILTKAHNMVESTLNPTHHAEIIAINQACALLNCKYLYGYEIYISLEPCVMCAAALSYVKIDRIFFGAYDKKFGAIENGIRFFNNTETHYKPEIYGGIMELESKQILQKFFQNLRNKKM